MKDFYQAELVTPENDNLDSRHEEKNPINVRDSWHKKLFRSPIQKDSESLFCDKSLSSEYFFTKNKFLKALASLHKASPETKRSIKSIEFKVLHPDSLLLSPSNNKFSYSASFCWEEGTGNLQQSIKKVEAKLFDYMVGVNLNKMSLLTKTQLKALYGFRFEIFRTMTFALDNKRALQDQQFFDVFGSISEIQDL